MSNDVNSQTIALAAMFQFANAVENLAKTGHIGQADFKVAVDSLLAQNPNSTLSVYGNLKNIESGLQIFTDSLRRKASGRGDCVRYVMGMLHLQRQLEKTPAMLETIASRLEQVHQQVEHFSETHENVVANLADIYSDTISTFSFRIQVMGEYQHLQQARVANQIRTLLFAGIRSAVLWRQSGGRRLKIIFNRNRIAEEGEKLLQQAKTIEYK